MYLAGALHDIGEMAIGNEILEKPRTKYQNFVHMCDYLASRKCILLPFDDNNNINV